ncbi:Rieske (2Fe-2S) protein [Halobaculum gomorrense]|uniref:Ferredoxin subunit of nitrite reductase or a ring-hydroxylating dioxygenase n=1 Tax=Halobaculum gomorrense TaxID=43928 RepID=A0A1M5RFV8_9EURY|nr:Rieske 2Fe-2S domain-containing protein [Halobaculum gomorrense]SHH25262.1 Ferredoxin subunit of nitrite reductase or a ring-hydroxylating dioxygenase [Halobaculum gomorrense]
MAPGARITSIDEVPERGSHLFTVSDLHGTDREVILVRCDEKPGVRAWVNVCPHEYHRLDRGRGAAMRDGEIIRPKHGSMFDACAGDCDNGEAAGTTLTAVEIAVDDGDVCLTDKRNTYRHEGGRDDEDGPNSTTHIGC